MKSTVIINAAIAMLALSPSALSQDSSSATFDPAAAETNLRGDWPFFSKSLHEYDRYRDGARGVGVGNPLVQTLTFPHPLPPPFATELEWQAYYDYCGTDAIVLATHRDSTPILTHDKTLVYTMSRFSVVDVIKSDGLINPGQDLVTYRLGGTVEDGGEKLRIDTPDMAAFEPQQEYILHLTRDRLAYVVQYRLPEAPTIAVSNNTLYPIRGKYAWLSGTESFPSESAYPEIKERFSRVARSKPCK